MKQQHAALGGLQIIGLNFDNKKLEREERHFHIIRQISLMQDAGLQIVSPDHSVQDALHVCSNRLLDVLSEVGYDPLGLSRKAEVPPAVYLPLFDLGVHRLRYLCQIVQTNGNQTLIVPASHLQTQLELQGLKSKVSKTQRALNRLTLLITSDGNDCALDPAKYGRAGDLPAPSRVIRTPSVLQLLRHREADGLTPKQRQILEAFLSSGPSTEELRTAAEHGKAPVLTNKRKSRDLPRASPFEVRKELPHFEQLIEALLLCDRQAADQEEKSGRKLRPRRRGKTGDSNLQKLVRQLPMCGIEAGYVTFLRKQCSQPEVVALLYDDHYQILELLMERWVEGSHQYLVKWQPHKFRTWQFCHGKFGSC